MVGRQVFSKLLISAALVGASPSVALAQEANEGAVASATEAAETQPSASGEGAAAPAAPNAGDASAQPAAGDVAGVAGAADAPTAGAPASGAPDSAASPGQPGGSAAGASGAQPAAANPYEATVALVGQWANESRVKQDTTRDYTSADDKLGKPLANHGSYRGAVKTFLGWSDQAPGPENGLVPGARLFSAEDTVKTAFPNGIPADAKLYAVYYSMTPNDEPLGDNQISMGLQLVSAMNRVAKAINKNTVSIDGAPADFLPDTDEHAVTTEQNSTTVIDTYAKKNDTTDINEVRLTSHFEMDPSVAMLVYRNPAMTNSWIPVLSRAYADLYKGDKEFDTRLTGDAGYTYVDLKVKLGEGITLPENLYLSFAGYSWRPLYVLNEQGERLNILNPSTGADLGNTKNAFSSLVSNTNPEVKFGVKPNGSSTLIVRCVLRHGANEKIPETSVVPRNGKSIAETITENMTLRVIPRDELKALQPNLTDEQAKASVLRIADAKAAELAASGAVIPVMGSVRGSAVADIGSIGSGWLSFPTRTAQPINEVASNTINLGYWAQRFAATYQFVSGTPGKDLPAEVLAQLPQNLTDLQDGTSVAHAAPATPEVREGQGTWKFRSWYKDSVAEANKLSTEATTVAGADLAFVGEWVYEEDATYTATYTFVSGTPGKELPPAVGDQLPQNRAGLHDGDAVAHRAEGLTEVREGKGTWRFRSWYKDSVAEANKLSTEATTVAGADLAFVGEWVYEEDEPIAPGPEKPIAPGPEKPVKVVPVVKAPAAMPTTGDATGAAVAGAGLLAAASAALATRVRQLRGRKGE
ncbi:hypothetical protein HLV38_04975 [Berryella wangjianweii]|uniref:SHIRT domain-containing protein n=1 Tax=Berryella wangjianweii TaxID=2734634 RepID=A0A6M8J0N7_9ACTN|nr:SHIRT domain-containing protein [Berryella wangjianweii]QKF07540.1 hypothetical protein HLV38_04975 [Berryella wangjianweii]